MEVIEKVCSSDPSPATKSGELKYNDIYIVKINDTKFIHVFMNNTENKVAQMQYNEKFLNELKSFTWTVETNGTTIKSNSSHSYTNRDVRLLSLLEKYELPKYIIVPEEDVEKNLKLYGK